MLLRLGPIGVPALRLSNNDLLLNTSRPPVNWRKAALGIGARLRLRPAAQKRRIMIFVPRRSFVRPPQSSSCSAIFEIPWQNIPQPSDRIMACTRCAFRQNALGSAVACNRSADEIVAAGVADVLHDARRKCTKIGEPRGLRPAPRPRSSCRTRARTVTKAPAAVCRKRIAGGSPRFGSSRHHGPRQQSCQQGNRSMRAAAVSGHRFRAPTRGQRRAREAMHAKQRATFNRTFSPSQQALGRKW